MLHVISLPVYLAYKPVKNFTLYPYVIYVQFFMFVLEHIACLGSVWCKLSISTQETWFVLSIGLTAPRSKI